MTEGRIDTPLGSLLRSVMKERFLSMRKLGELTGIDTATISRIINDKRKANLDHLEKFSHFLDIPIATLLEASGYSVENKQDSISTYDESIQELLTSSDLLDKNISISDVEKHLSHYKEHVQTLEGKNSILKGFGGKLDSVDSGGPLVDQLKDLFDRFKQQKGNPRELAFIGSVLLYFIIPVDAIPDYLFAIGYLDDAIAVQLTSSIMKKNS